MNLKGLEIDEVRVQQVIITEDGLTVELSDGRTLTVPLAWFPRLQHGTQEERNNWRLIGNGVGIHWDDLDEDISTESLILAKPSAESQQSLEKWFTHRKSNENKKTASGIPIRKRNLIIE